METARKMAAENFLISPQRHVQKLKTSELRMFGIPESLSMRWCKVILTKECFGRITILSCDSDFVLFVCGISKTSFNLFSFQFRIIVQNIFH